MAVFDVFHSSDALFFGFVGEHGTKSGVADALDALDRGVELAVNDNAALVVGLNADSLEVEATGDRAPTNADQDDVCFHLPKVGLLSPGQEQGRPNAHLRFLTVSSRLHL